MKGEFFVTNSYIRQKSDHMRKLFLLFIVSLSTYAQEPTQEQAQEAFRAAENPPKLTIPENDAMFADLMNVKMGDIVIMGSRMYKVVGYEDDIIQRYGSLLLNPKIWSRDEIMKYKEAAIAEYKKGTPFQTIIEQYYTGDQKKMANLETAERCLMDDIIAALKAHKTGDVFLLENSVGTYVIVKNGEPYKKKAVQVLYLKY